MPANATAGSSKKRALQEESSGGGSSKITKVHPFFAKPDPSAPAVTPTPSGSFQWLPSLGPNSSCLHGINHQPKASIKVAALDLDGTIIESRLGSSKTDSGKPAYTWWRSFVPDKLKELHESGYAVVIISNQALKSPTLKVWKEKLPAVGNALKDVPFRLFAATQRDQYRKPMPGMWNELVRIFKEEGVEIDKSSSFFVGDAAGRQYGKGKADFASTDRKWALNVGIPFFTPEEFFLKLNPHKDVQLPGFHPSSLLELPPITPTSTPIIPDPPRREVVLFVGYPCLGKSTFYRKYFQEHGYVHINQDTLKTRDKCVKAVQVALKEGKSCVVDNTNRDSATRRYYVKLCEEEKIPVRCFLFTGSIDLAWHNNIYRAFHLPPSVASKEPQRTLLPYLAFTGFRDNHEEPQLSEGFSEIKKVNWVFKGDEGERKNWSMWLQIDGK